MDSSKNQYDEELAKNKKSTDPDGPPTKNIPPNKKITATDKVKAMKLGKLGKLNLLLNAGVAAHSFSEARSEGDGVAQSAVKATAETVIASVIGPGKYLASLGLMQAPGMVKDGYEEISRRQQDLNRMGAMRPFAGNTFVDNKQIFTMRQASMAIMQQSKYSLEHAMQGNEASFLHR